MNSDLPNYELTSPHQYQLLSSSSIWRRSAKILALDHQDWQKQLAYPPLSVVEDTLANSTCLAETLECETRRYMCYHFQTRLH